MVSSGNLKCIFYVLNFRPDEAPRSVENVYNHHMFPGKAGIMQRDVTRAALAVVLPFLSRIFLQRVHLQANCR